MTYSGTIDALKLVMKYDDPALLLIIAFTAGSIIYAWLVRTNPFSAMRGLMTVRKQRLERLLDHRLKRAGVMLCISNDLCPRYLRQWRGWLTVRAREIELSKRWYRTAWYDYMQVNLPLSTVVMGMIAWVSAQ